MTRRYKGPALATDVIIEYIDGAREGIVLIRRGKEPDKGKLALPGGFAEKGLTLEENAIKESKEETGLVVLINNPERPLLVKSHPLRDPRGHLVSVTYIASGSGIIRHGDDAAAAALYTYEDVRQLFGKGLFAFDHEDILLHYEKQWLARLRAEHGMYG